MTRPSTGTDRDSLAAAFASGFWAGVQRASTASAWHASHVASLVDRFVKALPTGLDGYERESLAAEFRKGACEGDSAWNELKLTSHGTRKGCGGNRYGITPGNRGHLATLACCGCHAPLLTIDRPRPVGVAM